MKNTTSVGEHNSNGLSKLKKYGWKTLNEPGELRWIHKDKLLIDSSYQREATKSKVLNIASEWSWEACAAISVADRDSYLYVFDGGNRVAAALKRPDIEMLPCIVHKTETVEEEAKGFIVANTNRKPVTSLQKFKALIVVQDPIALLLLRVINESGYEVRDSSTAGSVKCIRAAYLAAKNSQEVFLRIWPVIVEISDGEAINDRVLRTLVYVENQMGKKDMSLTRRPWRERLVRLGAKGVKAAAERASAFYVKGGEKVWGKGLIEALNKGVRQRITLDEAD